LKPEDINTYSSLNHLVNECRRLAQQNRHRHLLRLSGEQQWCVQQTNLIIDTIAGANSLWIGEHAPHGITQSTNHQALTHLGGEYSLLIYNAFSGFDPDAFGALSGTLAGGGLLILLTPPLDSWPDYTDPESERIAVAGYSLHKPSHFLSRISRVLRLEQSSGSWTAEGIGQWIPPTVVVEQQDDPQDQSCRTRDQTRAVEAIIQVVKGHTKRPLVITSDRGRGKSSALGIAAARLILKGYGQILVTAPRQSAVSSLFEMASKELGYKPRGVESLRDKDAVIQYVAPDLLLSERPSADLLLVDEAAAIPTPLLRGFLHHYPRIVFATTVHGYEGTGLGFNLRFKAYLDQERPQWREITLKTPVRWAAKDPLEGLVFNMLALDAEPAEEIEAADLKIEELVLAFPDQQQLLQQDHILNQLFGLLVLAHYRTTPRDLWHLLDGPNLQSVMLMQQDSVVAVALLASEGAFPAELAEQIWLGRRRPQGHLLAQSLSAHLGLRSASTLKGLRIMRIAVHPALQNRGLGKHLLSAIKDHATTRGFDYLGVSCGATPRLVNFWQNNELHAVRLGLRAGASSSHQSVMFIQALNDTGEQLLHQARKRYAKQLPALLRDALSQLSAELVIPLLKHTDPPPLTDLEEQDWLDLIAFAFANRGYELTQPSIEALAIKSLSEGLIDKPDGEIVVMRVLQQQPWGRCATALGLSGRKGVENRLRQIMQRVILHYGSDEMRHLAQVITND
jgi:tRNA(Met) cytidine acetyltransferase